MGAVFPSIFIAIVVGCFLFGFAMMIETAKRVMPQMIKYGQVIESGLGRSLANHSAVGQFGIKVDFVEGF